MCAAVDPSQSLATDLVGSMDALQTGFMTIEQLTEAVSKPKPLGRRLPLMPGCAQRLQTLSQQAADLVEAWGGADAQLVRGLTAAVELNPSGCSGESGLIYFWDSLIR
jgi:hypothetical protein